MTRTLVTENFGVGVGFDLLPPPVTLQRHQYNIQMRWRYLRISDRPTVPDYRLS